ncbi:MAG: HIT family protein [Euryarchaeota archaeon]|nr:HIT family protein [Euryarchaeota archaeon]
MRDPNCIFCKIVEDKVPSVKVYEDEHAVAFLDIAPLANGHTLVIPRNHAHKIEDLSETDNRGVWELVRIVVPRLTEAMAAEGMTVAVNNGEAAGQEVHHVHVHLIPRRRDDGYGPIHSLFKGRRPEVTIPELEAIVHRIRAI